MRNAFTVLFLKASGSKQRQDPIICWGWGERKVCALGRTRLTIPVCAGPGARGWAGGTAGGRGERWALWLGRLLQRETAGRWAALPPRPQLSFSRLYAPFSTLLPWRP